MEKTAEGPRPKSETLCIYVCGSQCLDPLSWLLSKPILLPYSSSRNLTSMCQAVMGVEGQAAELQAHVLPYAPTA